MQYHLTFSSKQQVFYIHQTGETIQGLPLPNIGSSDDINELKSFALFYLFSGGHICTADILKARFESMRENLCLNLSDYDNHYNHTKCAGYPLYQLDYTENTRQFTITDLARGKEPPKEGECIGTSSDISELQNFANIVSLVQFSYMPRYTSIVKDFFNKMRLNLITST